MSAELGGGVVGFSPLSGRSLLLSPESAALLELLAGSAGMTEVALADQLDQFFDELPGDVIARVAQACLLLEEHGLVTRLAASPP